MNAAKLLVECLKNEQVAYIFGIPGEENLHLIDALLESEITFITTRHEQGAAFMADVYGRLTGKAGVCLATLGPGAMNLVTGVADANMDHAPLVAIAGQASTTRLHKQSHQVLDMVGVFDPITKFSSRILTPVIIPEVIRKAFKLAQSEKKGACFIEFPENIASEKIIAKPLAVESHALPAPDPRALSQAAELISNADHPIILAGNGVIRTGAQQALIEFVERLNIPLANTFMAKGVIPFRHPMALGSAGLQSNDYVSIGFNRADVIICVGYDLVEYHPYLWHPTGDRVIVHIDATPAEVDANYTVGVSVLGNMEQSLTQIANLAKPHLGKTARQLRGALIKDMDAHKDDAVVPMKPQKIIWDLRTELDKEDVVICDVGAHKMWMARMFRCEVPNTCLISNGFASMGIALPGAIAAKLALPRRHVVAVTGDGGFLMNVQELETAVRLGLSFVVLIWNDNGLGLIEWKQQQHFGRPAYTRFGNPDFVKLSESFGATGYRVQSPGQLTQYLRQGLDSDGVTIIDCPVDYSENMKLTEKLGEIICPQ